MNLLSADEQRERMALIDLVAAYLLVQRDRGREHDRAGRRLGLALSRFGPFVHDGLVWSWECLEDSIVCRRTSHHDSHRPLEPKRSVVETMPQSSRIRRVKSEAFGGRVIKGRSV